MVKEGMLPSDRKCFFLRARDQLCLVSGGNFDGFTDFAPSRKIPFIREILALLWFDGLDGAIVSFQEKTGPILLIDQGQPASIRAQARVVANEEILIHLEMGCNSGDFLRAHADKSGPAAAGRTALTEIGRRHE